MQVIKIDQLPEVKQLTDDDRMIVNQEETSRADLGEIKKHIQGELPEKLEKEIQERIEAIETETQARKDAIKAESQARIKGDQETLEDAKLYTDQTVLALNKWLPAVNTTTGLPSTGLNPKDNYLCMVVADPVKSGVYQAAAGWTDKPNWLLFNDTTDLVNEQELEAAVGRHNVNEEAHESIRIKIAVEAAARDQQITAAFNQAADAVSKETAARQLADQNLQGQIDGETELRIQGDNETIEHANKLNAVIQDIIKNHIGIPEWDSDNYILTFIAENGSTLEVDIPLESLARDLDFDPSTKELVITRQDSTEIRVNVADLVSVYEGSTGSHIQITVESGNVIKAALLPNSITEDYLSTVLQSKIDNAVEKDQMGAPDGVATLDAEGKIPESQLPEINATFKDAPTDNKLYGRKNEEWAEINTEFEYTPNEQELEAAVGVHNVNNSAHIDIRQAIVTEAQLRQEKINQEITDRNTAIDEHNTNTEAHEAQIKAQVEAQMKTYLLATVYRIGTIYISVDGKNPAYFIGGTWEVFANNRVLKGTDGNSSMAEGGNPSFNHRHSQTRTSKTVVTAVSGSYITSSTATIYSAEADTGYTNATIESYYKTVVMFRRVG